VLLRRSILSSGVLGDTSFFDGDNFTFSFDFSMSAWIAGRLFIGFDENVIVRTATNGQLEVEYWQGAVQKFIRFYSQFDYNDGEKHYCTLAYDSAVGFDVRIDTSLLAQFDPGEVVTGTIDADNQLLEVGTLLDVESVSILNEQTLTPTEISSAYSAWLTLKGFDRALWLSATTLPDGALGGTTGKGFTCTGFTHDSVADTFWVGNTGQGTFPDPVYAPSFVNVSKDFSSIISEIPVLPDVPSATSMQGVTIDSSATLWGAFPSEKKAHRFTKAGVFLGTITLDCEGVGIAANINDDTLIFVDDNDKSIRIYSDTGTYLRGYLTGLLDESLDQLFYNPVTDLLYITTGLDKSDGDIFVYNNTTGERVGEITTIPNTKAIEGMSILSDTDLYVANDNYFHDATPYENNVSKFTMPTALEAPPAYTGPLDLVDGAIRAVSMARRLSRDYDGFIAPVRRSSDDAIMDIGFVNNVFDEVSFTDFVGGFNGLATALYDQSGHVSSTDYLQSVLASQAVIDPIGMNGKACLDVSSGGAFYDVAALPSFGAAISFYVAIYSNDIITSNQWLFNNNGGSPLLVQGVGGSSGGTHQLFDSSSWRLAASAIPLGEVMILSIVADSTGLKGYLNGVLNPVIQGYAANTFSGDFKLLSDGGVKSLRGKFGEQQIFGERHNDLQRETLENDMMTFFGVV